MTTSGCCPRCRFARLAVENLPGWTDGLIGRALTVEASKLYAQLHYRAELAEYLQAGEN